MDNSNGFVAIGGISSFISLVIAIAIIAANWKIYEKAGKPGWASIVPIYNLWVLCEILWPNGSYSSFCFITYSRNKCNLFNSITV